MDLEGYTVYKDSILGSGIGGHVYLGVKDGVEYAIKEAKYDDPLQSLSEWMFLRMLNHENIVKPKDVIVQDKTVYFILPRYRESLASYVKVKGKDNVMLPETTIRDIAWQLLLALDYMHSNSVAHRDLKPSNIMITDGYKVKVIDLGLAKHFYIDEANIYPEVQTPIYRAPEVEDAVYGGSDVQLLSPKMDIYSLGLIVLDLFHGREIDEQGGMMGLSERAMMDTIHGIPSSAEAKQWILSTLVANPRSRPGASTLLRDPWFGRRPSPVPRTISWNVSKVNLRSKIPLSYRVLVRDLITTATDLSCGPDTINMGVKIIHRLLRVDFPGIRDANRDITKAVAAMAAKQMEELYYNYSLDSIRDMHWDLFLQIFEAMDRSFVLI